MGNSTEMLERIQELFQTQSLAVLATQDRGQPYSNLMAFAATPAASDALFTEKLGKVISTLNIASLDLHSGTIVLTRNNPSPLFVCRGDQIDLLAADSIPLGTSRDGRPIISELPVEPGLIIVSCTDGLMHAGERCGAPMDVGEAVRSLLDDQDPAPQELADSLLAHAVSLDDNRPADDISVLVLKVASRTGDNVRRMTVRLPIDGTARL